MAGGHSGVWKSLAPLVPADIQGLTEDEAAARKEEGQVNTVELKPRRTKREIISQNTVSIFNLSLIGIAIVQLLLGMPLDALMSLGVMILNIGMNIFQEMFAKRRLRDIELSNQPRSTVIREGKARSIIADDIVIDDMLVLGPGDQLFVDGELVGEGEIIVDESILGAQNETLAKGIGDKVYAGSFCIRGRTVYKTTQVGSQRQFTKLYRAAQNGSTQKELTPIERIIDRVLKVMLLFVAVFTAILLSRYFRGVMPLPVEEVIDVANVIFSIAPAGLFFMIFLTYAAGTADLVKLGALVHRARSVESMAQVDVMCFARDGVLTGTRVEMETVESSAGDENIPEPRIRQILGDYVRSTTLDNLTTRAIFNNFEGSQREILEEAPFYSAFGWSAIVFDDSDLRGVYILGDEMVLEPYLIKDGSPSLEEDDEGSGALSGVFNRVSGLFNRRSGEDGEDDGLEINPDSQPIEKLLEHSQDQADSNATEDATRENVFKRLFASASKIIRREQEDERKEYLDESEVQQAELLFAYYPEIIRLYGDDGLPQLPEGILPLSRLRYFDHIRPEAVKTIEKFSETGVSIKVFSPGNPERTVSLLAKAGMVGDEGSTHQVISGTDLAHLNPGQLATIAERYNVFGHLVPQDAARIIEAMRSAGHHVAVLGDGVNDVPALRQADLSIVMQSSSQAAQSVADIILLEDSPTVLQRVLDKGQRIVTGLLDILKLYLVQIFYIGLMIIAVRLIAAVGFPYKSVQGSLIAVVTVTLPALAITFWASPGIMHSTRLRQLVTHFVFPAAITMSTAGMVVYYFFLVRYDDLSYAQLAVTYILCITGLLLILFLKPPTLLWAGGAPLSGDRRYTLMVLILMVAFYLLGAIPLAERFLYFTWLEQPSDYLLIAAVAVWWAFTLRFIWFLWPLEPDARTPARYIFSRLNLDTLFSWSRRKV
ncbi:MAG: HAD-IC family P-type ATPase [Anaerolineales bacterium]